MHVADVISSYFSFHLSERFEKCRAFYISDGSSDFHDGHVVIVGDFCDSLFDVISDMGNHLDVLSEEITVSFCFNDFLIDFP